MVNPVIDVIDQGHINEKGGCKKCGTAYPCLTMTAAREFAAKRSAELQDQAIKAKNKAQRSLFA